MTTTSRPQRGRRTRAGLYANTKSLAKTPIVVLAVPFSVIGAVWLLWALDYTHEEPGQRVDLLDDPPGPP